MRAFDGGDNAFHAAQIFESVHRLIVGNGHVLSATGIVQPCMLRPDSGVIEPSTDGVHWRDLAVLVLAEIRFHAMKHTKAARVNGCRRFEGVDTATSRLASNKLDFRMIDEMIEGTHSV